MKKESKIEITEIFTAKVDGNKFFRGIIKREQSEDNNPIVYGKIKVNDKYVCATAKDQWELGEKLDSLAKLVLYYNINKITPITSTINISTINENLFFLN